MKKILFITGSFREKSFNRQLAEEAGKIIAGRAEVSHLEFSDIPYMDQDIEFPTPESIKRVRDEVMAADGIWIISAEYNSRIPGLLKNLLDWLSRPMDASDRKSPSAAKGKNVTISGVAGKSGALGVRTELKGLLETMSMNVIGGVGTGYVLSAEAYTTNVLNISEEERNALTAQVNEFIDAI